MRKIIQEVASEKVSVRKASRLAGDDGDDNSDGVKDDYDEDETNHNSANFDATTSRFCMVIDLNETYMMMMTTTMMMMMMMTMKMMMIMMMKMKLIITRPILKLQP